MGDTLEIIKQIINKLKINLLWIVPLSILIGGYFGFITKIEKPVYKSYSKIFPMTTENGGDGMNAIKAQFGITQQSNLSKYYNVNELVNSKNISRKIVVYPTNNPKQKYLYDWILEDANNLKTWPNKKIIIPKDSIDKIILASNILKSNVNIKVEKTDFTTIEYSAGDEKLSLRVNECILKSLSDFYINSKTEKARADLLKIGNLRDSLKGSLDYVERSMAGFKDESKYVVKEVANIPQVKLQRLREEIIEQYKNTTMAYQNANFKVFSESPIFQVLDMPTTPVSVFKNSWFKSFIIPFIISLILLSIFAIRKIIYSFILNEIKKSVV